MGSASGYAPLGLMPLSLTYFSFGNFFHSASLYPLSFAYPETQEALGTHLQGFESNSDPTNVTPVMMVIN